MNSSPPLKADQQSSNLLNALRPNDLALLRPHLESVRLVTRQILYQPGDDVGFVYFPCGPTLISFIVALEDGKEVEIALVGREGALGGIVSQGRLPAYARSIVQIGGPALRLDCAALEKAKLQSPALRHFFARYADCLLAQIFQCVACNAAHSIEQRASKWLLAAIDRTGDLEFALTQEQLSGMLGVGRSYVARVIKTLKDRGLIAGRPSRLQVLDKEGLKAVSCKCNESVKEHFDDVLKGVYPDDAPNADGPPQFKKADPAGVSGRGL